MRRHWALAMIAWAGLAGCEPGKMGPSAVDNGGVSGVSPSFTVNGEVSSEKGQPLADAQAAVQGLADGQAAASEGRAHTADANGLLALRIAPPGPYVAGTVRAAGYAPHAFRVPIAAGQTSATFTAALRPVDRVSHFTLPSSSDGPTSFSIVRSDGQVTVTVLPNTLVMPNGKIAVGDANMSLTYWNPTESLRTAPADLNGADANGIPRALQSFGMVHVEVEQAGQMLQIAPSKNLPLAFQMPPELAAQLSRPGSTKPALYCMNSNTGLWERPGQAAASPLIFADDHGAVTTQLPHLGSWGLDGLPPPEGQDGSAEPMQVVTEDP